MKLIEINLRSIAGLNFKRCVSDDTEVGSANKNQQHQVVFNSNSNEFLVVYIQEVKNY